MKRLIILSLLLVSTYAIQAQNSFLAYMDTARNYYKAGKLQDAHYAMMQMLQELELKAGNEIMKLLPLKFDSLSIVKQADEITANRGYHGSQVKRAWLFGTQNAEIEIENNSPQVELVNLSFNNPLYKDGKSKLLKVQGYKAKMNKDTYEDNGKTMTEWEIQILNGSTLITFTCVNIAEADVMRYVNSIPLPAIIKLIE